MRNPFRNEADAFRLVLLAIGYFALIVIAAAIDTWVGLAVFVLLTLLAIGAVIHARREPPQPAGPIRASAPGERRILVIANETVGGETLRDEIRRRSEGVEERVRVVCPALMSPVRYFASDEDQARANAHLRLERSLAALREAGVTAVFNLVQDVEYEQKGGRDACASALAEAGISEERVEVVDYGNLLPGHIELAATTVLAWLQEGERVYVHCRAGMQRSATVAAAIVALHEGVEPLEALRRVRKRNPRADPLAHQRQDLLRWWEQRRR
jgi:protein-tyrosine phosphatase